VICNLVIQHHGLLELLPDIGILILKEHNLAQVMDAMGLDPLIHDLIAQHDWLPELLPGISVLVLTKSNLAQVVDAISLPQPIPNLIVQTIACLNCCLASAYPC